MKPIENPFHLHKFDREQFEALLQKSFSIEAILPVYISVATAIGGPGTERVGPLVSGRGRIVQIEADTPRPDTFMAVCSKGSRQTGVDNLLIHSWRLFKEDNEYRAQLEAQRDSWNQTLEEREKHKAEVDRRAIAVIA